MSGLLRAVGRRLAARVAAAYDGPDVAGCEAYGGPCDGRRWDLRGSLAPIWLVAPDGSRHLYVPERGRRTGRARYRYASASALSGQFF